MAFVGFKQASARDQLLELLELVERDGRVGFFYYAYSTDSGLWSPGQEKLYGIELPAEGITWERWASLKVREDYEREVRVYQAAVDARRESVELEYRIVRSDGAVRCLLVHLRIEYAGDGAPTRVVGFSQDITEKKEMEQRLAEAEQRKSEVFGRIATDLAGASRGIRQALEVARRQGLLLEPLTATSADIERGVDFLERMTGDLRSVADAARGTLGVAFQRFAFERAIDLALQNATHYLSERDVRLSVCSSPGLPDVNGDHVRLAQVMSSLLIALAQHTSAGEHVTLAVNAMGGDLVVSLSNTADGEAAGEPAREREVPSSSLLSLELAQAVMRLHGGSVGMSKGAREGSYEFVLRLPLAAVPERFSQR